MANQEHLDIFGQGLAAWNSWRQHNPDARPDLDDADLRDANLGDVDLASRQRRLYRADFSHTSLKRANLRGVYVIGADFSQADLAGANLSGTFLVTANLTEADLHRTDLRGAILNGARLILADLTEARLEEADLQGADLKGARLAGADFRNCTIGWTTFGDTDVSVVRCLDTVEHRGPSVIGIDTNLPLERQNP